MTRRRIENAAYLLLVAWVALSGAMWTVKMQATNEMRPVRGCQWP